MNRSIVREKVLKEIRQIPERRLPEVYHLIRRFSQTLGRPQKNGKDILKFAGCWADMPEDAYNDFIRNVAVRRKQAFQRRKPR